MTDLEERGDIVALYHFHDTAETPKASSRPSEALCFDGVWLDDEIPGFRTLYTSGRESFTADVTEIEAESIDGSAFLRRRILPRTIIVGYQLIASSPQEFMDAFNLIKFLMSGQQKRIVFADEADKFYVGTCKSVGAPEHGRLAVTAEMELYCTDPFKYSENEVALSLEFDPEDVETEITKRIIYPGTYPARPVIRFEHTSFVLEEFTLSLGAEIKVKTTAAYRSNTYRRFKIDCRTGRIYGGITYSQEIVGIGDITNNYERVAMDHGENVLKIMFTGETVSGGTPSIRLYVSYRPAWL